MEPPARPPQAPYSEREPHREGIIWPIEKEVIIGWLMAVRLSNAQNDCYQNAAFQAMFWALLQLKDPMWNELGEGAEKFAEPFGMDSMWISLKDLPGFGEFLRPWGEGQQDLHEFLGAFLEGEEIRITDRGAPHNPPTLSAPANTVETDLQTLVDSWTHYLGMQTTFHASGRLACLHLDRFAHDHQGHLRKCCWNLEVNARIWLPIQGDKKLTFEQHSYIVVAAVSHKGQDEAGHLQAIGLSAQGWIVFNDLVEAQVVGSQPPLTDNWIFVWLAREDAVDLGLGRFGLLGTDTFPRTIATLHQQHAMHMERYPEAVLTRLRSHCSVCGKLTTSHEALCRHVSLRRPELSEMLKIDDFLQTHQETANIPRHGCTACPLLSTRPLNVRIGTEWNRRQQAHSGPLFMPGRTMAEEGLQLAHLFRTA